MLVSLWPLEEHCFREVLCTCGRCSFAALSTFTTVFEKLNSRGATAVEHPIVINNQLSSITRTWRLADLPFFCYTNTPIIKMSEDCLKSYLLLNNHVSFSSTQQVSQQHFLFFGKCSSYTENKADHKTTCCLCCRDPMFHRLRGRNLLTFDTITYCDHNFDQRLKHNVSHRNKSAYSHTHWQCFK